MNNNNRYLYVHPDSFTWLVSDNLETRSGVIRSGSAPGLCPASERSRYNKRTNVNSWQYWDKVNGRMEIFPSLVMILISYVIILLNFSHNIFHFSFEIQVCKYICLNMTRCVKTNIQQIGMAAHLI